MCALFIPHCIALPAAINLACSSGVEKSPLFQHFRSTKTDFVDVFEFLGEDDIKKSLEALLGEKCVCCIYGKATYTKVNQLRYDSFSQKYQGPSSRVPNAFEGIFSLLL